MDQRYVLQGSDPQNQGRGALSRWRFVANLGKLIYQLVCKTNNVFGLILDNLNYPVV